VVAEGVETADALLRLDELGCHMAQGYYVCKPLPTDELDGWLATSSRLSAV
jgi:EAL domain-containing protein (putative c-di-GMP-specific phosphodiesterase class I)